MPEYPYQTYQRLIGKSWPSLAELASLYKQLGITAPAGSAAGNIALQNALLGGWRPGAGAVAAPKPAAPAAPRPAAAAPRATTPSALSLPVQPGLTQQMEQERIALQKYIADLEAALARTSEERAARLQEAQLAANPADFVAYELYKRALEESGGRPTTGPARTSGEIQNLFSTILGLSGGAQSSSTLGTGRFGVNLPAESSISRSQLGGFSPTDLDILNSFLKGGVETAPGQFAGINPEDYFRKVERGLIPTIQTGSAQFRF